MASKNQNRSYFYSVGKRKTARAVVKLFPDGEGNMLINTVSATEWADDESIKKDVFSALDVLSLKKDFDFEIRVSGGGKKAQAEAVRLGISRAIIRKDPSYKTQLKAEGFLTRDARRKERKKPGLKRARRAPQFSKR